MFLTLTSSLLQGATLDLLRHLGLTIFGRLAQRLHLGLLVLFALAAVVAALRLPVPPPLLLPAGGGGLLAVVVEDILLLLQGGCGRQKIPSEDSEKWANTGAGHPQK